MTPAGRLVAGAGAGGAATVAMTAAMLAGRLVGATPKIEPEAVTEAGLRTLRLPVGPGPTKAAAAATHLAYGVGMGAAFGLVAPGLPVPGWARGPLFGLALALASYEGWVPAAGILPWLHEQPAPRGAHILVSHLVYGAVLGRLTARR
ncbi:MAG: DUF6789 family protein [Acidimicrobiales bacterium]